MSGPNPNDGRVSTKDAEAAAQVEAQHQVNLEAMGITQDEVDSAVRVLAALGGNMDAYRSRPFKELRKSLLPFIQEMKSKFPQEPDDYFRKKRMKKEVRVCEGWHSGRVTG